MLMQTHEEGLNGIQPKRETRISVRGSLLELPSLEPIGRYLLESIGDIYQLVFQPECGEKDVLLKKEDVPKRSELLHWYAYAKWDLPRRKRAYQLAFDGDKK